MATSPVYTGSHLLTPLAESLGQPLDQMNFLVFQLVAVPLGFLFTSLFPQSNKMATSRYTFCLLAGLGMMWMLIGWQTLGVMGQVLGAYVIMRLTPADLQHKLVLVFSVAYLLTVYIWRMTLAFEDLCYDLTFPLMITTQKVTSLAFSVSDWRLLHKEDLKEDNKGDNRGDNKGDNKGHNKGENKGDIKGDNKGDNRGDNKHTMDKERQKWAVRRVPDVLQFLSFTLSYQGILAGPFCHCREFVSFVEGNQRSTLKEDNPVPVLYEDGRQSRVVAVVHKLVCVGFLMVIFGVFHPRFPVELSVDPEFIKQHGVVYRLLYAYVTIVFVRFKYYITWGIADMVYNASGMGYIGLTAKREPDWTGMTNVNPLVVETATNIKMFNDNWNVMTTNWLRHVCYARAPTHRAALTFLLSALWHGLLPGYYVSFFFAGVVVALARKIRHHLRHRFQTSVARQLLYDVITWTATQLAIAYTFTSFVLLQLEPCLVFYNSVYWCLHLVVIPLYILIPAHKRSAHTEDKKKL